MKFKRGAPIAAAVIGLAVLLAVGLLIVETVFDSIDRGSFSAAANTTFDNITSYTRTGMKLLAVMIIVLVGSQIIAVWRG